MKKILALAVATVIVFSLPVCAYAAETTTETTVEGSKSVTAEDIQKLQDEITNLTKQIQTLTNAVKASKSSSSSSSSKSSKGGSGASNSTDVRSAALARSNAVDFGGNIISQGGHVEINGGKSNVTFTLTAPASGTISSAASLASSVGGSLINCVSTSSGAVSFRTAKVNFYMPGVAAGDNVAVYQLQGKNWVQLPVAEIRKDHVVVNMTQHGTLAFVSVPVLAFATN